MDLKAIWEMSDIRSTQRLKLRFLRGAIALAALGGGFVYLSILFRRYAKEEYFSGTLPDFVLWIYTLFTLIIFLLFMDLRWQSLIWQSLIMS